MGPQVVLRLQALCLLSRCQVPSLNISCWRILRHVWQVSQSSQAPTVRWFHVSSGRVYAPPPAAPERRRRLPSLASCMHSTRDPRLEAAPRHRCQSITYAYRVCWYKITCEQWCDGSGAWDTAVGYLPPPLLLHPKFSIRGVEGEGNGQGLSSKNDYRSLFLCH